MMMMQQKYIRTILKAFGLLSLVFAMSACTDLDEEVFSDVTADNFYNNSEEVVSAYMRPYPEVIWSVTYSQWILNELTADTYAWTQKGKHGYDNGNWQRLHWHQWTADEHEVTNEWFRLYKTIGFCNDFLTNIQNVDVSKYNLPIPKKQMIADIRALRAFHYLVLVDHFRNVPLVTKVGTPEAPAAAKAKEVLLFVEKELTDVISDLPTSDDQSAYGHISQGAAWGLLARAYINWEVWTGEARWDDCIKACDKVNGYALVDGWQDPFMEKNENCAENMFVIPFKVDHIGSSWLHVIALHYSHQEGFGMKTGCWNGVVTQPDHFFSFEDADLRKKQFLVGPQFGLDGKPLLGVEEAAGQPLVLTPTVTSMSKSREDEGARNLKYELNKGEAWGFNNDYVMLRYTEVVLTKAEALLRQGKGGEALPLVNKIRERAFGNSDHNYTLSTLTLDELLAERGREFSFEGLRRTDLVRFGKFTSSWWDKEASDASRNIFPIPNKVTENNPNLSN